MANQLTINTYNVKNHPDLVAVKVCNNGAQILPPLTTKTPDDKEYIFLTKHSYAIMEQTASKFACKPEYNIEQPKQYTAAISFLGALLGLEHYKIYQTLRLHPELLPAQDKVLEEAFKTHLSDITDNPASFVLSVVGACCDHFDKTFQPNGAITIEVRDGDQPGLVSLTVNFGQDRSKNYQLEASTFATIDLKASQMADEHFSNHAQQKSAERTIIALLLDMYEGGVLSEAFSVKHGDAINKLIGQNKHMILGNPIQFVTSASQSFNDYLRPLMDKKPKNILIDDRQIAGETLAKLPRPTSPPFLN